MFEYEGEVVVAIWTLFRKTLYPVTLTLSVETLQVRLIWVDETTVARRFLGVEGGFVSAAGKAPATVTSRQNAKYAVLESLRMREFLHWSL